MYEWDISNKEGEPAFVELHAAAVACAFCWLAPCNSMSEKQTVQADPLVVPSAGVLEVLTAVLAALLNLSTLVANQPKIARRGLTVLLKTNSSVFQVVSSRVSHACWGTTYISRHRAARRHITLGPRVCTVCDMRQHASC